MPTTQHVGTPSEANKAIGGTPNLHYFDFQSKGRGQVIRLLWEDAGIAYTDTRYSFAEYPAFKESQLRSWNPLATIPVVELNGRILTQSYAVLRHFARLLGKYDGEEEEGRYWADVICDVALDWRSRFVDAFLSENKEKDYGAHCAPGGTRSKFLSGINQQLQSHDKSNSGPYILGNTITYADLVLYQICHDEGLTKEGRKGLKEYERLVNLVDAVEQRPNVKKFLESDRYLG